MSHDADKWVLKLKGSEMWKKIHKYRIEVKKWYSSSLVQFLVAIMIISAFVINIVDAEIVPMVVLAR